MEIANEDPTGQLGLTESSGTAEDEQTTDLDQPSGTCILNAANIAPWQSQVPIPQFLSTCSNDDHKPLVPILIKPASPATSEQLHTVVQNQDLRATAPEVPPPALTTTTTSTDSSASGLSCLFSSRIARPAVSFDMPDLQKLQERPSFRTNVFAARSGLSPQSPVCEGQISPGSVSAHSSESGEKTSPTVSTAFLPASSQLPTLASSHSIPSMSTNSSNASGGAQAPAGPYAHVKGSRDAQNSSTHSYTLVTGQSKLSQRAPSQGRQQSRGPQPSRPPLNPSPSKSTLYDKASDHTHSTLNAYGAFNVSTAKSIWENRDPEEDDWLHNPDPVNDKKAERKVGGMSWRGVCNVGVLLLLVLGIIGLFMGYPLSVVLMRHFSKKGGFGLGGTNGTGQVPFIPGLRSLVDADTPVEAQTWQNPFTRENYHIVFSDEFEVEGRTFWPGDDPFWEAVDLHYAATGDFEWYSPEAVNTSSGFLNVVMEEKTNHNLNFRSGMLQSWNKFCFQGGYIEMSAVLPGSNTMEGFWPGLWMMGNLGRAGYLASTQGMWPYSYDSCDVGILANQTNVEKTAPEAALNANAAYSHLFENKLSYLEGMRTSSCTCQGEDHPGPDVSVGRAAPELDILEAQVHNGHGGASQSLQIAPFDADYEWVNTSDVVTLHQESSQINSYKGNVYQEAVSGVAPIPDDSYNLSGDRPTIFAIDYEPDWKGDGSGYVTWYVDGKATWTVTGKALVPNARTEVGQRLIPREPMSIVVNLAVSDGFQRIVWEALQFPAILKIDYIRVYQKDGGDDRISCDPPDHPTAKYIADHPDVYNNVNLTVFPQNKYGWPRNQLKDGC